MKRVHFLVGIVMLSAHWTASAQDIGWLYQDSNPSATYASCEIPGQASGPAFPGVLEGCGPIESLVRANAISRSCRVTGAYEFGWLQPRFSNNVSVVVQRPTGNRLNSFGHSFDTSSRLWVGIENSRCNGIRARHWHFDTDAPTQVAFATASASPLSLTIEGAGGNLSRTATANLGDAMTSNHHLEMRTIDLEATHRFRLYQADTVAVLGLRYAKTHQRAHAVATDGTGALTELVCQDLDFEGFGPSVAVEMTRWLFVNRDFLSRFSCYANTRGSILFGTQEQAIVLVTGGGATLAEDSHTQDDFLPIAEIAGGLQFGMQPFGRALWTIRTGYRAEAWFGTGGPVDSDSNLGLHGMQLALTANW